MSHVIPGLNTVKSCRSCPSFDQGGGRPNCSTLGRKPLLTITSRVDKEKFDAGLELVAEACAKYGEPAQSTVLADLVPVGFPMYDSDDLQPVGEFSRDATDNCSKCLFFADEYTTSKIVGFEGQGLCTLKGALVNPRRQDRVAAACESRRYGGQVLEYDLLNFVLFPEYNKTRVEARIKLRATVLEAGTQCLPDGYEPSTYVGNPALPEHEVQGIRTWVVINDPSGSGNVVQLPVFSSWFWTDDEAAKVPKSGQQEHPELYVDHNGSVYDLAVAWIELDETPALWGAPGVGKTELARHMAWIMAIPFERISITGTTEVDDLQGVTRFKDGKTYFHEGRVTRSWKKPNVMLVDEPNVGQPEVWHHLRPLTDNSKQLVVDADEGNVENRHPHCYLTLAMNPAWDPRNMSTNELADADIRRLFHIFMELPTPEVERQIIRAHCKVDGFEIPDVLLDNVMRVAESVRRSAVDRLPISWGIGHQIKVARYLNWFPPVAAYKRAATASLEPSIAEIILNDVRTVFES